ncbi:hypothetical protein [Eisenbergiella tayi]|nr:hypothetical protein [Eisenbergiella tayi]
MDIEDVVYDFSVRLVELVRYFKEDGGGFPLCDKLLDCGVRAGISARAGSHEEAADYVRQADYILEMAVKSGYLTERQGLPPPDGMQKTSGSAHQPGNRPAGINRYRT